MGAGRILQNQEGFYSAEYRARVTPLLHELHRKRIPEWICSYRFNGFASGILMYICSANYDVVITVGHRSALTYGLLNRLLPRKKTAHVAKEFYFGGETGTAPGIKTRLLGNLYRYALHNLNAVIVNATGEIEPYARDLGLPVDRFFFIPWPSNIDHPVNSLGNDGSVFAVGRSLRDWNTFFTAVEGISARCVVVASRADVARVKVPSNVELHCDIPRDRYLELLKKAKMVVLPLKETNRSTGQASFLEAMAYSKPVVVAGVSGVWDYIEDGRNGLIYRAADASDLQNCINLLYADSNLAEQIGAAGYQDILERFNKEHYARCMLHHIDCTYRITTR